MERKTGGDTIRRVLTEPLLHFLLIGAALFLLFGWKGGPAPTPGGAPSGTETGTIVVARSDIDQMVQTFTRTWQREPTDAEVSGLIESFVRDEIYFREAQAIGLDRGDNVIRRRLRLKMEYIFEDIGAQGEPTEADLTAYFKQNADRYRAEPQIAFRQVYINTATRGAGAEPHARQLLDMIDAGADPDATGDPFLLETEVGLRPLGTIGRHYGETFAAALPTLEVGKWQGPIRSGYGLHLVLVADRTPERLPPLAEVRDRVKRDWAAARQQEVKDAAYARLKDRYEIVIEKPVPPATVEVAEGATTGVSR